MGTLDLDQRVQPVALTPSEAALQLVGIQVVGMVGVPGQVGDRGELRVDIMEGWDGSRTVLSDMASPHAAS
jgi:ribosomal protein S28E/S33